ncbi:hypothetical protein ACJA88_014147 [Fusarium oxysporum]
MVNPLRRKIVQQLKCDFCIAVKQQNDSVFDFNKFYVADGGKHEKSPSPDFETVPAFVDSLVRNSKYLHLPKHKLNSGMSGSERLRVLKGIEVMMQNVKANADVGRIALGLKHDKAEPLRKGRLYR